MNYLSRLLVQALFLLLSLSATAQSGNNRVITILADSSKISHKNLLITGFGTIPVRHFMENLSPLLIEHYGKLQLKSNYEFVGNKANILTQNLILAIRKHQPDVVLMVYEFPEGPDTLVTKQQQNQFLYQALVEPHKRQRVINPRKVKLEEYLQAVLYEPGTNKVIWRGELYISGNATRNTFFQKICDLLTEELQQRKLLSSDI